MVTKYEAGSEKREARIGKGAVFVFCLCFLLLASRFRSSRSPCGRS